MNERFVWMAAGVLVVGGAMPLSAGSSAEAFPGGALLATVWESRPTEHLVLVAGVVLLGLALWRRARHPHS